MTHHPLGQLPELSPDLGYWLSMVTAAAHRLRDIGSTDRAVSLLRRAGDRVPVPHAAAGMHALADLFAAHPPLPKLKRRRAA
jgi:hypothetical protein